MALLSRIRSRASLAVARILHWVSLELKNRKRLLRTPARFIPLSSQKFDPSSLFQDPSQVRVVFEIGASNGDDSLRLLDAFPEAAIHCFEIDSRAVDEWTSKVFESRAELHLNLVGQSTGTAKFYASYGNPPGSQSDEFPDGWHFSGSIREPRGHTTKYPWVKFRPAEEYPIVALDDFCMTIGLDASGHEIDLIWMDVQGAEGDVIRGGSRTLSRTRFIYAEYSDLELYAGGASLNELCELLRGFKIKRIWSDDVLFENESL